MCHSDIHAGNILIGADDAFYIVDWDNPILAPKERDLMFVGGGQGFTGHTPQEEETLFYRGYGETQIDPVALAYYRYERIIQDIAVYCEQLFLSDEGGEDRAQALRHFASNFLPRRHDRDRLQVGQNTDGEVTPVCRSIKTLFNFEPPATEEEIRAASLQFVQKAERLQQAVEGQRSGIPRRRRRDRSDLQDASELAGDECASERSGRRSG